MEIYIGTDLPYPLDNDEYNNINNVWNFINEFSFLTYILHDYRSRVIENIKNKYSVNEFYDLEKTAEKLFWNLRHRIPTSINNLTTIKQSSYENLDGLLAKMYRDTYYRSFINKLILIDDKNHQCYYKPMEGSADIFTKNDFNLCCSVAFYNRDLYEKTMENPRIIHELELPHFYYQYDYPFPNINYVKPFIQTDNYRIKRIKKMYYDDDAERQWFVLLKP